MEIRAGLCWGLRELLQAELSCWSRDTKGLLAESQITYTRGLCWHHVRVRGWQVTAATSALISVTKPQPSRVKTSTVTACSTETSLRREWAPLPPSLLARGLWGTSKHKSILPSSALPPPRSGPARAQRSLLVVTLLSPCCHPTVTSQGPPQAHFPPLPHPSQ